MCWQTAKFHPNRFTLGRVIAERVNTVFCPVEYFHNSPEAILRFGRMITVVVLVVVIEAGLTALFQRTYIFHGCRVPSLRRLVAGFAYCVLWAEAWRWGRQSGRGFGSCCIPSCITRRPLPTCQMSLKSKKLCGRTYVHTCVRTHVRTARDGHLRPALLGRPCRRVDLKTKTH